MVRLYIAIDQTEKDKKLILSYLISNHEDDYRQVESQ